jgi:hypothetical protein
VLTASWGPVWITSTEDGVFVEISHSGREAGYRDYEAAAERLVACGLLSRVGPGWTGSHYKFTARGEIARWAVLEDIEASHKDKEGSA